MSLGHSWAVASGASAPVSTVAEEALHGGVQEREREECEDGRPAERGRAERGPSEGRPGSGSEGGGTHAEGLVPCAISSRGASGLDVRQVLGVRMPTPGMVDAAASLLVSARQVGARRGESGSWAARESVAWRITVAPGLVRVSTQKVGVEPRGAEVVRWERSAGAWAQREEESQRRQAGENHESSPGGSRCVAEEEKPSRSEITQWSAKSRARMVARLATLDYGPLYAADRAPAMVTLTLPGCWEQLAPTGKHFKAAIKRWKTAYARRFGAPVIGIWKLEFQGRGAPHLHLLLTPPGGSGFAEWLSHAWRQAAWHGVEVTEELRADWDRHLLAGTGVDYREGTRMTDPKRMAIYFAKHSAPGGASSKEYQHRVPEPWQVPGAGPGRFWGVWGLEPVEATVEVSPDDAIMTARILRRHSRAQGLRRQVRVWRPRYDEVTGEAKGSPWRTSTVRAVRMTGTRGFVCLNDAPAMVSQIARYLDLRRGWSPGSGVLGDVSNGSIGDGQRG